MVWSNLSPLCYLFSYTFEPQENLIVSGGTCSLDASTNDTHVVQIVTHPGKALCSQLILAAKGLGEAIIIIQDVGLSPRATTHSLVHHFGAYLPNSSDTFYTCYNSIKWLLLHTMFILFKWLSTSLESHLCICALSSINLGIMITFEFWYISAIPNLQSTSIRLSLIIKMC
jgi:hypothetical protein